MPRLLSPDVLTTALDHAPLPLDEVVEGSPTTAVRTLDALAGAEVGLWEMSEGTARDTEADEVFVVVSGRGHVDFEDGERLELAPGVAVRLAAGERTVWTVTERLRKVWVA
jgi:uncharacterized cupin superfamily protein